MPRFTEGQKVVSNTGAQGLKVGAVYVVRSVRELLWGVVVYAIQAEGGPVLEVSNGHLYLEPVDAKSMTVRSTFAGTEVRA